MDTIRQPAFRSQLHAEDVLLMVRYMAALGEVAEPTFAEEVTGLALRIRERWSVSLADEPASGDPLDYPAYIREKRRPTGAERAAHQRLIVQRWMDNL